jgi:hypothetical protein
MFTNILYFFPNASFGLTFELATELTAATFAFGVVLGVGVAAFNLKI